ncbi:MAG: SGNH/GDSL hydrolase family protein [Muribaculaceae bacterium]|nr:SGNH/GDSL hydrolase family protein [Muribaculaceae bacterium]
MFLIKFLLATIAFLGDSNLWLGREDCSNEAAWSYWMADAARRVSRGDSTELQTRSFARSGATLTNTIATPADTTLYSQLLDDANTLYNQALRLNGAVERGEMGSPDIIMVYGGTNDAWFADRRPGLFDSIPDSRLAQITPETSPAEASTLRESLILLLRLLRNQNPESRIILVGPPLTIKAPDQRIHGVTDIMEEISRKENLQMIRLDSPDIIDPELEAKQSTLTIDGVHTSPLGAQRIGYYIYNEIAPISRCSSEADEAGLRIPHNHPHITL